MQQTLSEGLSRTYRNIGFFLILFFSSFLLANRYTEYIRVAPGDANIQATPILSPSGTTTTSENSAPPPHGKTKESHLPHGKIIRGEKIPQNSVPTTVDDDEGMYVFCAFSFGFSRYCGNCQLFPRAQ
jgi:hypothetical protein